MCDLAKNGERKTSLHFAFFGYNCFDGSISKDWKGRIIMTRTIRLTPDEVQHFVDVTTKCDFDIDIFYNRYTVDAKSFLGVYGLDFTKPLTVSYDGYNEALEKMLKEYAIAC